MKLIVAFAGYNKKTLQEKDVPSDNNIYLSYEDI